MSLSLFIARRYLFSKKSHNAINIITAIAIGGIALATAAMICVLSVFNGFRDLVAGLYTAFDPELVVVPAKGKYVSADDPTLNRIRQFGAVQNASATLQENALILFRGHPLVVTIKGVDDNFPKIVNIRTILINPHKRPYRLQHAGIEYGVLGQGLAQQIGTVEFGKLQICAPTGGERINLANPIESFSTGDLFASGMSFSVGQRKYDDNYILTSLDFARTLFAKEGQLSRLELKLKPGSDVKTIQSALIGIAGKKFRILDRIEQQAGVFNVMNVEKLIAYLFLTFIVLIACFNIISSLSMLMIEKRDDAETLCHLGLSNGRIRSIFMLEGRLITLIGASTGLLLGIGLCFLQEQFGIIRMGNGSNFIVSAYPVSLHATDLILIFLTVLLVGFLSVWYPVHAVSKRLLK